MKIAPSRHVQSVLASLILVSICIISCSDKDNAANIGHFEIITDAEALAGRLTLDDRSLSVEQSASDFALDFGSKDFSLNLIASVAAPVVDGFTTQATDMDIRGDRLVVSYNSAGDPYRGAVDLIDVSDPKKPILRCEMAFKTSDVNAVHLSSSRVFLVGATSDSEVPAYISSVGVGANEFSGAYLQTSLSSFAGTDVTSKGNTVYAVSGNAGGAFALEKSTLDISAEVEIRDARSISSKGNSIVALSGTTGELTYFDEKLVQLGETSPVGGATKEQEKSSVNLGAETVLVALNDGGAKIVCRADNKVIGSIPAVKESETISEKTVTNSAYLHNGLLFTANGEAGVYVYHVRKGEKFESVCKDRNIHLLGKLNFGSDLSANHVVFKGKHLFVADGLGGVKIVSVKNDLTEDDDTDYDQEEPEDE
jgi:hypothetical protein